MRRFLLFAVMLLGCLQGHTQERMRLAGYLQVPGKPLSSYYVYITISGTKVTGYSITDWTGGNRLKASVTGTRSPSSEMYIQEMASLDDRSSLPGTYYCYFSAHLKLTIVGSRQRWSGPFDSRQPDGTLCDKGVMTLLDDAPDLDAPTPKSVPKPALPPAPKPKPKPLPKPEPPPVVKAKPAKDTSKPVPAVLKPVRDTIVRPKPVIVATPQAQPSEPPDTCLKRYNWSSSNLELDVFDGWTVDGDIVSVSINGHSLLDHATLSNQKQHFSVPLAKGWNTLSIFLHDDGFDPPVTPNLTLADGAIKHNLEVSGERGEVARICIYRK